MSNFAIFAHARSGSTSLAKVLNSSPDVNLLMEPFHERHANLKFGNKNYQDLINDKASMSEALDEIYSKFNAIKVLQYQFPDEIYVELLKRKDIKIIFLRRNNLLESSISAKIAEQTNVWQKEDEKGEIDYSKLKPLSIKRIGEIIEYVSEQMEYYENFLQKNRKGEYMKLVYEELFSEDFEENKKKIGAISNFLNIEMPKLEVIEKYMKPSNAKIGKMEKYKDIPNYEEIVKTFVKKAHIDEKTVNIKINEIKKIDEVLDVSKIIFKPSTEEELEEFHCKQDWLDKIKNNGLLVTGYLGNNLAGFAICYQKGDHNLHIWNVGVLSEYRGMGVWKQMFKKIENFVENKNYTSLTINTYKEKFPKMYNFLTNSSFDEYEKKETKLGSKSCFRKELS